VLDKGPDPPTARGRGVRGNFAHCWPPIWLKLDTNAAAVRAVRAAFNAAFAKLLWPLVCLNSKLYFCLFVPFNE